MLYTKLYAIAHRLAAADKGVEDSSTYFGIQDEFKVALRDALKDEDVLRFNKAQLLHFISWCSSHRPCEPHVILSSLSMLNDKRLLALNGS